MNEKSLSWNSSNLNLPSASGRFLRHHPSELMLRSLFSSSYSAYPPKIGENTRVLDIGTMYVNNLVPFHDRGCRCFGVEINEEMVAIAKAAAAAQGIEVDIKVGGNCDTGQADNSMDVLLSINVIHYENDTDGLRAALREYYRVLDREGRVFIVSAAPGHHIRASARRLGSNRYEVTADDFRQGQIMAYFEDEDQLGALLRERFSKVETGRATETHARAGVDFFYAVAVK